mgnify:CR=1 FL=1
MGNYFRYLWKHVVSLVIILCIGFLSSFIIGDLINQNQAYYEAKFEVDNIQEFNAELLINEDFLNEIKNNGENDKYKNIDIEKMLAKGDFSYFIEDNRITIQTKYKYYDLFFLSSNNTIGTRAKMFIKDSVSAIAFNRCEVTFLDSSNIVELKNEFNRWKFALFSSLGVLLVELLIGFILYKKNKNNEKEDAFQYDNMTLFSSCFHKEYWKFAFKPYRNVKEITTIAMLFSLMLASKFIPIPSGFGNLGLSFTYLFFAIIALIYGPIYGFVVGIFSDIIGFFLTSSGGGVFNFGYTLQAALSGMIYGLCFFKTKVTFSKVLFARFLINIFMNAIYGSFLFIFVTYFHNDSSMTFASYLEKVKYYALYLSLPKNVLYLLPQSILLYYVLQAVLPILSRFNLINKDILRLKNYK